MILLPQKKCGSFGDVMWTETELQPWISVGWSELWSELQRPAESCLCLHRHVTTWWVMLGRSDWLCRTWTVQVFVLWNKIVSSQHTAAVCGSSLWSSACLDWRWVGSARLSLPAAFFSWVWYVKTCSSHVFRLPQSNLITASLFYFCPQALCRAPRCSHRLAPFLI